MSRYTTQLRYLLENPDWTDERLGLGDYPIFMEDYRETLNQKIKNAYYFEEIGFETPARFAFMLSTTMNRIMPYYNQLYETTLKAIDPFLTMDYTVVGEEHSNENTDSTENKSDDMNTSKNSTLVKTNEQKTHEEGSVNQDRTDNSTRTTTVGVDNSITEYIGGSTDTRSGSQTLTKSGSEKNTSNNGTTYEHGLSVKSDTPEGFVQTESISDDTWASSAEKNRKRVEQEVDGTNILSFTSRQDKTNYDNLKDTHTFDNRIDKVNREYQDNVKDTLTVNNDTTHGFTNTVNASEDTENIEKLTMKDIMEKIDKIIKTLDANSEQHFKGFNGRTMTSMLMEWRDSLINIDDMIIKELEFLFISILN